MRHRCRSGRYLYGGCRGVGSLFLKNSGNLAVAIWKFQWITIYSASSTRCCSEDISSFARPTPRLSNKWVYSTTEKRLDEVREYKETKLSIVDVSSDLTTGLDLLFLMVFRGVRSGCSFGALSARSGRWRFYA